MRKRWLAGDVDDERSHAAVHDLRDLAIERTEMQPLLPRMYEHRFNLTAHDASDVALRVFECPLLTSDRRLAQAQGLRRDVTLLEG